jgi:hypothetical protein
VHNGSGNLFVLHKGGNGTSLAVLFHREPERVCSFRLKCSANVAPGWHRPPPPAIDTESQHGHLHYVTVFEAQSSVVGAQGIEPSVLVLVAQSGHLLRRVGCRASSRCRGQDQVSVSISAARSCSLSAMPSSSSHPGVHGEGRRPSLLCRWPAAGALAPHRLRLLRPSTPINNLLRTNSKGI